jgi:fibro-slime domain-containing protein
MMIRTATAPLILLGLAGVAVGVAHRAPARAPVALDNLPMSIELVGTVRDFRERTVEGGHPDFEGSGRQGFQHGWYANIVQDELGSDGKPVFRSNGHRVNGAAKDGNGRQRIHSKSYIKGKNGDKDADIASSPTPTVTSAESFESWYRDVPGLNASRALPITLRRDADSNVYVFDDKEDDFYKNRGGFFPINGELFGNSGGGGRANTNYHFTYELATQFTYEEGAGHIFRFLGDDDVFVFVDGKLVIDIGGTHSAIDQTIELDRLDWLEDGRTYSLHFFFAERHRTASNFRMETTLNLRTIEPPQVSGQFD